MLQQETHSALDRKETIIGNKNNEDSVNFEIRIRVVIIDFVIIMLRYIFIIKKEISWCCSYEIKKKLGGITFLLENIVRGI